MALLACVLHAPPGWSAGVGDLSRPDPAGKPTEVRVGLYLADLYEVSGADQTFVADVVVQAEWLDQRMAGAAGIRSVPLDDVWNPRLQLLNQRGVTATLPQRVEVVTSGLVRWKQRWMGRFSARMDLRDFPVDRQRFAVQVVSLGFGRDEVDIVVDSEEVRSGRAPELSIADWDVGPSTCEGAEFEPVPGGRPIAGARLTWEGRRYVGYYAVQVIFPLVLIVLMGWAALWVDPSVVATRVSVAMTTMLTLIAYRFALGKSVPNLSYLTRFDYFMLASTVLIFLVLVLVAAGAHLVGKGKTETVRRIDSWARLAFPAAFTVAFVMAWWV